MACSVPTIVLDKEIQLLAPEQTEKMVLQVHFHHHLLPLKLSVLCNGKRHPAKLHPDIAYFVRPLPMDLNAFLCKENQLRGMFEYARRSVNPHQSPLCYTSGRVTDFHQSPLCYTSGHVMRLPPVSTML